LKRNLDRFITDCLENNLPDIDLVKAFEAEKIVFAMKESIKTNMLIKINS
tara:strand:- start:228 stop:377 length:150 start_codon:yes stop_codon:yes gene_type:complete